MKLCIRYYIKTILSKLKKKKKKKKKIISNKGKFYQKKEIRKQKNVLPNKTHSEEFACCFSIRENVLGFLDIQQKKTYFRSKVSLMCC